MNLKKSAKGKNCTLEIINVCNHDNSTTKLTGVNYTAQSAHETSDVSAIYACSACKDVLNGRKSPTLDFAYNHHRYVAKALILTHEAMAAQFLNKRRAGDLHGN